jgi:hypothetical protein
MELQGGSLDLESWVNQLLSAVMCSYCFGRWTYHVVPRWDGVNPANSELHLLEGPYSTVNGGNMDALVEKLSNGDHPVEVIVLSENRIGHFRDSVGRGFVHIKFTETRGGTELGVTLLSEESDLGEANLDAGSGRARLVGKLTLNYVAVRCIAEIKLPELTGLGRLELVTPARAPEA